MWKVWKKKCPKIWYLRYPQNAPIYPQNYPHGFSSENGILNTHKSMHKIVSIMNKYRNYPHAVEKKMSQKKVTKSPRFLVEKGCGKA